MLPRMLRLESVLRPEERMRNGLLIAVVLALNGVSAAQAAKPVSAAEKHTAMSSLEFRAVDGKEHTITRNQRFSVIYRCLDECSNIVLRESFYSDQEEGVEGAKETVSVIAWPKDKPDKVLWNLKAAGSEGRPLDDFYEITWFGCCGDWNEKSYFSLRTGKKVFSSSTDDENALLEVQVPNTRTKRYITYRYLTAEKLGQVQFGDSETVRQTVTIKESAVGRPPSLSLRVAGKPDSKSVSLWAHDADKSSGAVSGVSVVLGFESGERQVEVVLPIENDRIAVQKARLPKGFSCKGQ